MVIQLEQIKQVLKSPTRSVSYSMSKQINGQGNQKTKGIILITDFFFFLYNACFKKNLDKLQYCIHYSGLSKFFFETDVSLSV